MKFGINLNLIGVGLVAIGFIVSLVRVISLAGDSGGFAPEGEGKKVIRILHWQLEPGYREGLDKVMAAFNELPENKAAGVEIRQLAVTERVYPQFLNVHILSGTAPDICERGKARMTGGDYTAKYFEPLGDVVDRPNPFNRPENLPEYYANVIRNLDPQLREVLQTQPMRETFIDGMRGGWDDRLQEYYAIPTSFWGPVRLYYNKTYMQAAKQLVADAVAADTPPAWLQAFIERDFIHNLDDPDFRSWAMDLEREPDTYGRLLLICTALQEFARQEGRDKLVPISGSNYSMWIFNYYLVPFTSAKAEEVDYNLDSNINAYEMLLGWKKGDWSLDSPRLEGYFGAISAMIEHFPPGFLGLDREQANRRFVLGNGAMIATGGWDAGSLFQGAAESREPFEVGIMSFPLPGPGEKWGELISDRGSEAGTSAGAPYMIFQQSRNKDHAIRFLQFFASYAVNQEFNRTANWIPVVLGTSPTEDMRPFMPDPTGISPGMRIDVQTAGGLIGDRYAGQFQLFLSDDVSHQQLMQVVQEAMENTTGGLPYRVFYEWRTNRDRHRKTESMLAAQEVRKHLLGLPDAQAKHNTILYKSVADDNAVAVRQLWYEVTEGQPFPDFDR